MEDSRPQAILKFHRLSSLDYRVRHELPINEDATALPILLEVGKEQAFSTPNILR